MPDDLSLAAMMAEDAVAAVTAVQELLPDDAKLKSLAGLAAEKARLENEIKDLEAMLAVQKEELKRITTKDLPDAMRAIGVNCIGLTDGSRIELETETYVSIPEKTREQAFEWLRANGHEGIIKNAVTCSFGKGQDDEAGDLVTFLESTGYSFDRKTTVHASTLKAWAKSMAEDGVELPPDIFSVYTETTAEVTKKGK